MKASVFGLLLLTVCAAGNSSQPPPLEATGNPAHGSPHNKPVELQLQRAGSKRFDLRKLPHTKPKQQDRPEFDEPELHPIELPGGPQASASGPIPVPGPSAPAPPPNNVFEGLDRFNWGAGSPPDTNGDVGPTHYIETVNTSIGVFRKSDGFMEAAFTFNTFMSQGSFGNLCDSNNFGDPVVLYDTFEDRWVITDFAFLTDINGNVVAPAFQCFAVSMSGDPISGGWNFYSRQISDNLDDYPKFGIWPDGLYMSANMFSFGAGSSFKGARAWAFNKAQMYAGSPTVQVVQFDVGGGDFTVIPSNARLQSGTPPIGTPNYFVSTWQFLNALTVYKFHVDWNSISLSTFTGPDVPLAATSWPNAGVANVPQSGTTQTLDALQIRAMVQNQYTNLGGIESLWVPHTVRRANTTGFAAPRWYQADVTGGTVAANLVQATTWDPDGANVMHRWMPSLALDRAGNMAMGYSTSSSTTFPSIKYAGRLAADPVNTFSLTEQTLFDGTASQLSSTRWGDYSSMTLDPDGCTFWYANEYATGLDNTTIDPTSFNKRWKTKFGSFGPLPGCTPVGAGGTVTGTVTQSPGGSPLVAATVMLGSRSATTDGSGVYSFTIAAGTYPTIEASLPGYSRASASNIVVTDGGTTTQNFALTTAPPSACISDTTQADFLLGVATNVDLNTSPGDITLSNAPTSDQANTAGTTTGTGFGTPAWTGQTFVAGVTGTLVKADIQLFCNGCGATPPDLTLSVRATSAGLPTGGDLASTTVPGSAFASGATVLYTASFGSPATLTSGTQYALILRPVSAPTGSGYFWIRSSPSTYANGSRVLSANSGATWSADTTRDYNFRTYMQTGYAASGNIVSATKDSNPAGGLTPIWSTLSWNATVPANTSVQFQVAGSNNVNGPFNFVGPDGTASTFFTSSPVQLSPQFYSLRYLQYKAFLATTDSAVTPTLSDATICFNDTDCSTTQATIVATPPQVCANSTGNTASGDAGMTAYGWGITNGTITSASNIQSITYSAGASTPLTLDLSEIAPNACMVSSSLPVTVNPLPPKPTISGTQLFCSGSVTTLSSSATDGNQWLLNGVPIVGATGQTYDASAAGNYTVQVTDGNGCVSVESDPVTVTEDTPPPVPTISGNTNGTGTQDQACPEQPLTLNANGATGATSYQWYKDIDLLPGETNSIYQATGAATYYVTATDANMCTTAQSAGYVVQNPTPHSPFISFRNQDSSVTTLAMCQGSSQIIDSDSATGIQWYKDGIAIPGANSQSYTDTQAGVFTAQLDALGCHSQFGRNVTLTVDAMPPTPTISADTNGTGTQDQACPEQPLTLHANGATGATSYIWFSDNAVIPNENTDTLVMTGVGNISVVAINGTCNTTHSATYVVQDPTPHAPFISFRNQPSTTTSLAICQGSSQIIDSDSATGIHWWRDGVDQGPGNQSLTATQGTLYTAQLNALGCHSQFGRNVTLTIDPIPATPTITPSPSASFFAGGSVTLTSSSASGNQWLLNGGPIGGATNQTYVASTGGSYTVQVNNGTCSSTASAATIVSMNPDPTTTVLVSSQNPSVLGQSVTFTATITADAPSPGTPSGTVTFFDGAAQLGAPVVLNASGQALLTTSSLGGGVHSITANYTTNNESTYQNSISNTVTQTVNVFVSGSITGLTGSGLVLRLTYGTANTTIDLPASGAAFSFNAANTVPGDAYAVSVITQPTNPSETCVVNNASGSIGPTGTNTVVVSCSTTLYRVGVNVSGLSGSGLKVQLNGDNTLSVPGNGTVYFASKLASGSDYVVSISAQPSGQLCSVTNPTGTVTTADAVVPVTCVASTANLTLSIDDSQSYARYGQVLDYLVTLSNTGNGTADVSVTSSVSAGLDEANANWTCLGAGAGASCTASGSGAFGDTATLPPNRTLTWLVSMPVFGGTSDPDVTLSISAPGAATVLDTDILVIFRDGFNVPYGNGTAALTPQPDSMGVLGGTANQTFTLPPPRGNGIEDVLLLRADNAEIHVQAVTLGANTLMRVLTDTNGRESASAWAPARAGSTYVIGSVSDSNGQRVILLEGAERSLYAPLGIQ